LDKIISAKGHNETGKKVYEIGSIIMAAGTAVVSASNIILVRLTERLSFAIRRKSLSKPAFSCIVVLGLSKEMIFCSMQDYPLLH
jgi:hypothetical protein